VAYEGLYDGIDLRTWGLRSHLKCEFNVAPGAAWPQIQVRYDGIASLSLDANGALVVDLGDDWGTVVDEAPYIYQEINGQKADLERFRAARALFDEGPGVGVRAFVGWGR